MTMPLRRFELVGVDDLLAPASTSSTARTIANAANRTRFETLKALSQNSTFASALKPLLALSPGDPHRLAEVMRAPLLRSAMANFRKEQTRENSDRLCSAMIEAVRAPSRALAKLDNIKTYYASWPRERDYFVAEFVAAETNTPFTFLCSEGPAIGRFIMPAKLDAAEARALQREIQVAKFFALAETNGVTLTEDERLAWQQAFQCFWKREPVGEFDCSDSLQSVAIEMRALQESLA